MKKFIYFMILLLMVSTLLVLSGCTGSVEESSEEETPTSDFDFE